MKFNLQKFGNDDTLRTSEELKLGLRRSVDYKIEYLAGLENPRTDLTAAEVEDVQRFLIDNAIFLPSSAASDSYTSIGTAYIESKGTLDLDIS